MHSADQRNDDRMAAEMRTPGAKSAARRALLLRWAFLALVWALAVHHFSDNATDPDLWGHVLFGRRMLELGRVEREDPFSWTAAGRPWINHEVLAEVAMGWVHRAAGASGLLGLKTAVGLLTFGLGLSLGGRGLTWPWRGVAWGFGCVAAVEIAFGFSMRPQVFTALFLVLQIALLRGIHRGQPVACALMPVLVAVWTNTHGGVLAGLGLLLACALATPFEAWRRRNGVRDSGVPRVLAGLWLSTAGSVLALACNPWGVELPRWLIGSVARARPIIEEWNPMPLNWDHAPMFAVLAVMGLAFVVTRRQWRFWEMVVCLLLAVGALRHVRHTPLFCLAALAIAPPYIASALDRYRDRFGRIAAVFGTVRGQWALTVGAGATACAVLCAACALRKGDPFTMEVPRDLYPVNAVRMARELGISGNLLVFFDWGEMCLWELPGCRVSIDGRFDTCYPRAVIAAHWDFYNGETPDPRALPIDAADAALLHARLAGTAALERRPGWVVVYRDPLAVLLVREAERFPGLRGKALPIEAGPEAVRGRVPFACCQSAALSPVRSASAGGSALQAHTFTGRRAVAFSCP